jgi:coproporphyrinogen III oxidase-like Fe-S oxidoreductase
MSLFDEKLKIAERFYNPNHDVFYNDLFDSHLKTKLSLKRLKQLWKKYINISKQRNSVLHVDAYIHIPFCKSRCSYCQYNSSTLLLQDQIDRYLDYLESYFINFKEILSEISFECLYVGGGSANILSNKQTQRFLNLISKYMFFVSDSSFARTYEMHPSYITPEKLHFIQQSHLFNRASFGIQTFNKDILQRENRQYISPERTGELLHLLKSYSVFKEINVDLIAGLHDETKESILNNLSLLSLHKPDTIMLYTLQVNLNKSSSYKNDSHFRKWLSELYDLISDSGIMSDYNFEKPGLSTIGSSFEHRMHKSRIPNFYELHSQKRKSIFSVGAYSEGVLYGFLRYQHDKSSISSSFSEEETILAEKRSPRTETIKYIIRALQNGFIDSEDFFSIFKSKIESFYEKELDYLVQKSILKKDGALYSWATEDLKLKIMYTSIFYPLDYLKKL